jgi:hypothetical protein
MQELAARQRFGNNIPVCIPVGNESGDRFVCGDAVRCLVFLRTAILGASESKPEELRNGASAGSAHMWIRLNC